MRTPQLVSSPIAGHSVNGGLGAADEIAGRRDAIAAQIATTARQSRTAADMLNHLHAAYE
jgi:hypothetical protein